MLLYFFFMYPCMTCIAQVYLAGFENVRIDSAASVRNECWLLPRVASPSDLLFREGVDLQRKQMKCLRFYNCKAQLCACMLVVHAAS